MWQERLRKERFGSVMISERSAHDCWAPHTQAGHRVCRSTWWRSAAMFVSWQTGAKLKSYHFPGLLLLHFLFHWSQPLQDHSIISDKTLTDIPRVASWTPKCQDRSTIISLCKDQQSIYVEAILPPSWSALSPFIWAPAVCYMHVSSSQ